MFINISRISGEKIKKNRKGNLVDGFGNVLWESPENRGNTKADKIKQEFKASLSNINKFKSNIANDIQRFRTKAQTLENSGGKSGLKYSIDLYLAIPGLRSTQLQAIKEEANIKEKIIKLNQSERKLALSEEGGAGNASTGASNGVNMSTIAHARRIRSGATGDTSNIPKTRLNRFTKRNNGGSISVSAFSPTSKPTADYSSGVVSEVQQKMDNTVTDKELNIQSYDKEAKTEELENLMLDGFDEAPSRNVNDRIDVIPETDFSKPEQEVSIDIDQLGESENGIDYSIAALSLNQKGKKTNKIIKYYKDEANPKNDRWWLEYRDTITGEVTDGRVVSLSLIGNTVDPPKIDEVNGKVLSNIGETYELEKVDSTKDMPQIYKEEWDNHIEDLKNLEDLD